MLQTKARVCIHIQGFGLTWHVLWCFFSCLTQLGPFVDSKHEQIEVGCICGVFLYFLCTVFEASWQQTVRFAHCFTERPSNRNIWKNLLQMSRQHRGRNQRVCITQTGLWWFLLYLIILSSFQLFPPLSGQTVSWCLFHLSEMYITITFIPNRLSVSRTWRKVMLRWAVTLFLWN